MDRKRSARRHLRQQAATTHARRQRLLAAAVLTVAAATTAACNPVSGAAHKLEPGLGANYAVTNHTNKTLKVEARFSGPADKSKPFGSLLLDYDMTLHPGDTVRLPDVNLAANDCVGLALVAYAAQKEIGYRPSPLCVNAKAVGGWTITTATPASPSRS